MTTDRTGTDRTTTAPELCFNLWAFSDEHTGLIRRISGKAYVLEGTDERKSAILRELAQTDFVTVAHSRVPRRFQVAVPRRRPIEGAIKPSQLDDVAGVFGPLLDQLSVLPPQVRCVDGGHEQFRHPPADAPLYVLTVVVEAADGRIVASAGC